MKAEKITAPFHPITAAEARQWYKDGLLTTSGYLWTIRRITCLPKKKFIIPNVIAFCEEWGISKSAFYRAVRHLEKEGYMSWEATHGLIFEDSKKVVDFPQQDKKCPTSGTVSHERDESSHERDESSHERDESSHERDEYINMDRAHVFKYSDFLVDLSDGEREKFLEFGRKKAAKLPNPPELPDEWIAKYFEQIYEQFKKATENQLETSQDEQNKILRRRAEAQEFLSRSKEDSHLDQNSVPPREKSAVPPPDFAEIDKLLDEPEERSEGSKRGANSTGVDRGLVDKLKKKKQQRGFGFRDKKP